MRAPCLIAVSCALFLGHALPAIAAASGSLETEIRTALSDLERALQSEDPTAWVYHYTEDAVFVGEGGPSVEGREMLLKMAREMPPLRSVKISLLRVEGNDRLAYSYVRASWTSGDTPEPASSSRVRSLLVWRKDDDGTWRITQELMHADPDTP